MTRAAATRRARSSELQNEINRESNRSVAPAFGLAQDMLLGVHGHYTRIRQIGQVGLHEPKSAQQPIGEVIMLALAEDPRPAGCEPVKDTPRGTYRVRVGA